VSLNPMSRLCNSGANDSRPTFAAACGREPELKREGPKWLQQPQYKHELQAIRPTKPTHKLMMIIGVIEIIAGILVAIKPRIGAYVVAAWPCGIIINLLLLSGYYDVALRDFELSLGALALGRLSVVFE